MVSSRTDDGTCACGDAPLRERSRCARAQALRWRASVLEAGSEAEPERRRAGEGQGGSRSTGAGRLLTRARSSKGGREGATSCRGRHLAVGDRRDRFASHAQYMGQCISCADRQPLTVCSSRALQPSSGIWRQAAGTSASAQQVQCKRRSLRTYRFKRGDPDRVSVKHIVGLGPEGDYLPMLWETFRHSSPRTRWIDFKYQKGRSPWGLNKRPVLKKAQLTRLLRAYEHAFR